MRAFALPMLLAVFLLTTGFDVARNDDGKQLRWPTREVAVFVHSAPHGELSVATIAKVVGKARAAFNGVDGASLKLVDGGLVAEDPRFDIFVRFSTEGFEQRGGEFFGRVKLTADADGALQRATVELNAQHLKFDTQQSFSGPATADLQAAVTHLLGRAVGLGLSHDRNATMYFMPATSAYRSLEGDDLDAVRFAYPASPPRAGQLCDACNDNLDCAGGFCATWRDGNKSYCTRSCTGHDDCPVGYSCGTWSAGKACFPNTRHCDPERAKAPASGRCASDLACDEQLFCLAAGDSGFCTAACSGFCGGFGQCVPVNVGSQAVSLCLKSQGLPAGQRCEVGPDCASLTCAPSLFGGGFCSRRCIDNASCAAGFKCDRGAPSAFCVKPGPLEVGWPCASGFDCQTGLCAEVGGDKGKACTITCKSTTDCPKGTGCTPTKSGLLCLPYGKPPAGAPCLASGGCAVGLVCDRSDVPGVGICRLRCDPFKGDQACSDGGRCAWVGAASSLGGVCRGGSGGVLLDQPCDAGNRCRDDLACVGKGPSDGTCKHDCDLDAEAACGSSETCQPLDTTLAEGQRRGACMVEKGDWLEILPVFQPTSTNFSAKALDMTGDVLPLGSIVKKVDKTSEGGCSAGNTARRSGGWPRLLMALLILLAARVSGLLEG